MILTEMPDIVLELIFSFLSYDEIAKNRIVCKKFNETGWRLLNRGFYAAEKYQSASLKAVKSQLPRRESERRKHPLSKKCDILLAIETRLSILSVSFGRFIETKLCCFIPGKVIDELFRVMKCLDTYKEVQPAYQFLEELRDVSTMAIEYFDDKIAPDLKKKEVIVFTAPRDTSLFGCPVSISSHRVVPNYSFSVRQSPFSKQSIIKQYKSKKFNKSLKMQRIRIRNLDRMVRRQEEILKELQRTVNEQAVRLSNSEAVINDLKKTCNDWNHNLSHELSSDLNDLPLDILENPPPAKKKKITVTFVRENAGNNCSSKLF